MSTVDLARVRAVVLAVIKVARTEFAALRQKVEDEMTDQNEDDKDLKPNVTPGESPQSRSIPGPTYPHPEGTNDPVDPAKQQDKLDEARRQDKTDRR